MDSLSYHTDTGNSHKLSGRKLHQKKKLDIDMIYKAAFDTKKYERNEIA